MDTLKNICLTLLQLIKQAVFLPRAIAMAVKQRRLRAVVDEQEVERLDRIRNPSKYIGR